MSEREAAARAAWDWARGADSAPARRRRPWVRILVQFAVAIAAATTLAVVGSPRLAIVALAVGTTLTAIGWLSPDRLYPRTMAVLRRFGHLVGTLTTWLLLTPFYYLVLSPFGLLTRRGRRDPLERRRDPDAPTYWMDRPDQLHAARHYERQL